MPLCWSALPRRSQVLLTGKMAQVIGEPAVVAGNSLGGYASLATAVKYPDTVKGVVLLNAAGRFEEVKAEAQAQVKAALPNSGIGQVADSALREVRFCCSFFEDTQTPCM